MMDKNEMIASIERATAMIIEARSIVDDVMYEIGGRHAQHYEAYGKYGFNQLLNMGNPYDAGLENIIDCIENEF